MNRFSLNAYIKRHIRRVSSVFMLLLFILHIPVQNISASSDQKRMLNVGYYHADGYHEKKNGTYSGAVFEYLDELKDTTNFEYTYTEGTIQELVLKLYNNEIDLMVGVFRNGYSNYDLLYSQYCTNISQGILTTLDTDKRFDISDFSTFNGAKIGMIYEFPRNNTLEPFAEENNFTYEPVFYSDNTSLYDALNNGEVDIIYATDSYISAGEKYLIDVDSTPIYVATNKQNSELMDEIDTAMELVEINNRFTEGQIHVKHEYEVKKSAKVAKGFDLSEAEMQYLSDLDTINVGFYGLSDFGFVKDNDLDYKGFMYEYFSFIENKLNLKINYTEENNFYNAFDMLKNGTFDMYVGMPNNLKIDYDSIITSDVIYESGYYYVFNKTNELAKLRLKVAINEKQQDYNYLINMVYQVDERNYDNFYKCLNSVNNGDADVACIPSYVLENIYNYDNFKGIYFRTAPGYVRKYSVAMNKDTDDMLTNLINKAIGSISDKNISTMIATQKIETSKLKIQSTNIFDNPVVFACLIILVVAIISLFLFIFINERIKYNKSSYKLRNIDQLTGARNLSCFITDGSAFLKNYADNGYSLLRINIRNFKYINDVYGTEEGDKLLVFLSNLLEKHLERNEIHARSNADNFLVLLSVNNADDVLRFFNEIKLETHRYTGMKTDDMLGDIYAGIYTSQTRGDADINTALEFARIAVRKASEDKLPYAFYEERYRDDVMRESEIIKNMYDALRKGEFQFYLQPQHHLKNHDRVNSAEALVRWIKSDGTVIPPGDFIPIFERNGFVVELDRYVFEEVCRFISKNSGQEWFGDMRIAVNVSKLDLYKRDFISYYTAVKQKYGIPDNKIELEFTESVVFEDYKTFKNILADLTHNGFICSLDDFGSGSSSLNVLKELSVDIIKMDRMFFVGDEQIERNNSVIASVIAMARGLGMEVIAEGVEESEQIDFLRQIGCDVIQGFVYSRPLPVNAFREYVINFHASIKTRKDDVTTLVPQESIFDITRQKYISTLKFVKATVIEIDLEHDFYNVVSLSESSFFEKETNGSFAEGFEKYARSDIKSEDKEMFKEMCSRSNLTACFYRGDESVSYEYRAKSYYKKDNKNDSEASKSYTYSWFKITFCRLDLDEKAKYHSVAFIENIQEVYEDKKNLKRSQEQLGLALKGIRGIVYEFDVRSGTISLIQNNSAHDKTVFRFRELANNFEGYVNKYVHADDREKMMRVVSGEFMNSFFESETEQYVMEYRKLTSGNTYIWKSGSYIKNANEPHLLLIMLQDISSRKMIEERLFNSERRLTGIINNLFVCVFEVDFEQNILNIIKSDTVDFWKHDGTEYSSAAEQISYDVRIKEEYRESLRKAMLRENIFSEFDLGKSEIVVEYEYLVNNVYKWRSLTISKQNASDSLVIIFIRDIEK